MHEIWTQKVPLAHPPKNRRAFCPLRYILARFYSSRLRSACWFEFHRGEGGFPYHIWEYVTGLTLPSSRELARRFWLQSSGNEPGVFCISRRYPFQQSHSVISDCAIEKRTNYGGFSEEAPRIQHHRTVTLPPVRVSGRIETCIPVSSPLGELFVQLN